MDESSSREPVFAALAFAFLQTALFLCYTYNNTSNAVCLSSEWSKEFMAKSRKYTIMIPGAAYATIEKMADAEGRPMADLVRDALRRYAESKGETLDLSMDRGGYRGGSKVKDDE
jgi:hypothetical protein